MSASELELLYRIDAGMLMREVYPAPHDDAERARMVEAAHRYLEAVRKLCREAQDAEPGYMPAEPGDVL
jgi:hypothetical protein